LYAVFPEAHHILIEPLEEFRSSLEQLSARLPRAEYIFAAAGSASGETVIHVHADKVGSSLYKEEEGEVVDGTPRQVPSVTLDEMGLKRKLREPFLIKLDVQGAELDVLRGAAKVLEGTQMVILEASLFRFFKGGPLLHDCVAFMKEQGFVVYDFFDPLYRPLDGALAQVDLAFVPEGSPLRASHAFATPAQRAEQNTRFLHALSDAERTS
jgi:FkbM family methyltransferase